MTESVHNALDDVEHSLRGAVHAQVNATDPDHGDFYAWGGLLTLLAEQTEQTGRVLRHQVSQYQRDHQLRDDAGMPPTRRVDRVTDALNQLIHDAHQLRAAAARFHNEVGHIGVELPPDEQDGGQ